MMKNLFVFSKVAFSILAIACFSLISVSAFGQLGREDVEVSKKSKKLKKPIKVKEYNFDFKNAKSKTITLVPVNSKAAPIKLTRSTKGYVAKGPKAAQINKILSQGVELNVVDGTNIQARHRKGITDGTMDKITPAGVAEATSSNGNNVSLKLGEEDKKATDRNSRTPSRKSMKSDSGKGF